MPKPTPSHRQTTLLFVEDDEAVRDSLTCLLVHEGFLVLTAATGHDAMGLLRTPLSPIDVVLLDVNLPDVNGLDLCARLREMYPRLPVVVCTGEAAPEDIAAMPQLGISRCLSKPVDRDELLATIEGVVPYVEACAK